MKKYILSTIIIVGTLLTANAQQLGAKAGVNFSNITGDLNALYEGRVSFHIGVVAEFEISETFSFQPELLYSSQGAKIESVSGYYEHVNILSYLNIPLMAKYYLVKGLSIEVGPQVGFLVSAKRKHEYRGVTGIGKEDIENTNVIDFGLNFGLGYKLDNGLNFDTRYNLGLTNIFKDVEGEVLNLNSHNGVIQLSVGYFFN